ncbi:MAG TPA: Fis family transcriptional regulator, partial [Deltaproteobacteria bacterium]|nr:Fis family transcriptional regulator [Deltaproteobacteria bacterium]
DLYYRLNVISVYLPPLRDRKEDVPLLVDHFLERFNIEMGKNVEGVAESAMRMLMDYSWPGNARELRNVIERAMVVTKGRMILEVDLSLPKTPGVSLPNNRGKSLSDMEKEHIRQVLLDNRWNIIRSAQVLGIDRVTLYNKIRKYELKKEPVLNS